MTATTWRTLLGEAEARLRDAGMPAPAVDARRLVEEVSGLEGAALVAAGDEPATRRAVGRMDRLLARRAAGEPLQYVLGRWGFRSLDLFVDRRVLIPRPETEEVVGHALGLASGLEPPVVAVDLGTGSGAIALSLAAELYPRAEVWAVEQSSDALAVARANLAGLGRAGTCVRLLGGSWFEPLPEELRGSVGLVVANPPYVADAELLPDEVADWEPVTALRAGPRGVECIEEILGAVPGWLRPAGAVVVEIGATQGPEVRRIAHQVGLIDVEVRPDLAGRDRVLVARAPGS